MDTQQIFPKTEHFTKLVVQCKDLQFAWGYEGNTSIRVGGCRYASTNTGTNTYVVKATCELQGHGQGISEHQVRMNREIEFVDVVITKERFKSTSRFEVVRKRITKGTWLKACSKNE
jgi:hypothetical protein